MNGRLTEEFLGPPATMDALMDFQPWALVIGYHASGIAIHEHGMRSPGEAKNMSSTHSTTASCQQIVQRRYNRRRKQFEARLRGEITLLPAGMFSVV